jgi:hypothetical protein
VIAAYFPIHWESYWVHALLPARPGKASEERGGAQSRRQREVLLMYGEFDKARLFFGDVVEETKLSTENAIKPHGQSNHALEAKELARLLRRKEFGTSERLFCRPRGHDPPVQLRERRSFFPLVSTVTSSSGGQSPMLAEPRFRSCPPRATKRLLRQISLSRIYCPSCTCTGTS